MIPHAPGIDVLVRVKRPAKGGRSAKLHRTRYFFFGLEVEQRTAQDIQVAWQRLCSEEGVDKARVIWARGSGYPMHRDQLLRYGPSKTTEESQKDRDKDKPESFKEPCETYPEPQSDLAFFIALGGVVLLILAVAILKLVL